MVEDRVCPVNEGGQQELLNWAEALEELELNHLLAEAQRTFDSDQRQYSALDSRIVAIVGWAIVGVGTLLVAGSREFNQSGPGIAAIFVIAGASFVVTAGVFALWPRDWAYGVDLQWYRKWQKPSLHVMKARGLAALLTGAELNKRVIQRRSWALQVAAVGLLIEFGALVASLVLSVQRA